MSEEKKNIIYTAEDIKRYITGEMSPQEMHAMEMAALDDPLLSEAMEGYELMEQKDWSKELSALKQQFNKKQEAPVIPIAKASAFKWWKAAAAIVVIGVTAVTAYIFTNKNNATETQELATVSKVVDSVTPPVAQADSIATYFNVTSTDSNPHLFANADRLHAATGTTVITTTQGLVSSTYAYSDVKAKTDSSFIYKPQSSQPDYAVNDKVADRDEYRNKDFKGETKVAEVSTNAAANNNVALNEREVTPSANGAFNNASNNFIGYVTTPDNKPVGYAGITLPESKKQVYADAYGKFSITAPDTTLKVTVSSAGFESKKITLQNNAASNNIVLQPQEIAVQNVGVARKRFAKEKRPLSDSTALEEEEAEPAGGWVEYNNYLSNNLKVPDAAKEGNIHGEVEVMVKLKNNGEISTVKVAKPLSPECDAEAVRVVKEGPKWDVKNNKKTKVKVKVKF